MDIVSIASRYHSLHAMQRRLPPPWLTHRVAEVFWQSKDRHYALLIRPNLWGELEVCRQWGGRANGRGSYQVTPVANRPQALEILRVEALRRLRRGYAVQALRYDDAD